MNRTTWDDVINHGKKHGFGDLTVTQADGIRTGPVKRIFRGGHANNEIWVELIWMAFKESRNNRRWQKINTTFVAIYEHCRPQYESDGTLRFVSDSDEFAIKSKHSGHLDPTEVYGLTWNQIRQFRAWEYDIPLDSSWDVIVERVVDDLGADGLVDPEDQMQVQHERTEAMAAASA